MAGSDFYLCETCRLFWPARHPEAAAWVSKHWTCTLPEYTGYDERMVTFAERIPVGLVSGNDIPEEYNCTLGDLELLAFGGDVQEEQEEEPCPNAS